MGFGKGEVCVCMFISDCEKSFNQHTHTRTHTLSLSLSCTPLHTKVHTYTPLGVYMSTAFRALFSKAGWLRQGCGCMRASPPLWCALSTSSRREDLPGAGVSVLGVLVLVSLMFFKSSVLLALFFRRRRLLPNLTVRRVWSMGRGVRGRCLRIRVILC